MKILTFVVGFLAVMVFSIPRIAAAIAPDRSEAIGTEGVLYLLGFLLVIICTTAFTFSAWRRSVPQGWLVGLCTGSLSASAFYAVIAFDFTGKALVAGFVASVLVSWVAPWFLASLVESLHAWRPR